MKNAKFLSLSAQDWIKSFWVFLFSTIISVAGDAIMQAIAYGDYNLTNVHWKSIVAAIVVAVISYLQKQFLTNSESKFLKKEPQKPI